MSSAARYWWTRPTRMASAPRVLVASEHAIRDGPPGRHGQPSIISRRMQFVMR
jgi:hypothetical protein